MKGGGFDASKFLEERPTGIWSDAPAQNVATVAGVATDLEDVVAGRDTEKTSKTLGLWDQAPPTVAGVATVAELPLDAPFAVELNAMFHFGRPTYFKRSRWQRLCADARAFALDHARAALACGWSPLDLFGIGAQPWNARHVASLGVVAALDGRDVGAIEAHAIEIIAEQGANSRFYNAAKLQAWRPRQSLMWEACHPNNRPPPVEGPIYAPDRTGDEKP